MRGKTIHKIALALMVGFTLMSSSALAQTKDKARPPVDLRQTKSVYEKVGTNLPPKPTASELRDIRDLEAQQEMAKWAFWMLVSSVLGSAITAVGLIFVWRTLHHTRRSADYSRDSVAESQQATTMMMHQHYEAEKANKFTREATALQMRAYVGPAAVNYHYNAENGAFAATAEIKNFGNTPAYRFKSKIVLQYLPFPVNDPPSISCDDCDENTLFPTMQTSAPNVLPMKADRLAEIAASRSCFFLSVILEYEDLMGKKHREKSGLYVTGQANSVIWNSSHGGTMTFLYGKSEELT